jgi:hypothetical protein
MAEIIDIRGRRRETDRFAPQAESLRRLIHCLACPMHCARCGQSLENEAGVAMGPHLPLRLCRSCDQDYRTFLGSSSRPRASRAPWQNEAWQRTWRAWIELHHSLLDLARSPEFQAMMAETVHTDE